MLSERTNEKRRLLYCSPSNKAVDVIAKFLKNRLIKSDREKLNPFKNENENFNEFDLRFVRVYSERIASSEYPHPKYFDKILSASPKLIENKQNDNTSLNDSNHSDPELVDYVLHHIVRKEGKPYAEELKKYDSKFSILREYEDRIRNRLCCCNSELDKFQTYNFRVCKHARYFEHVNPEFSMHNLLRVEKATYSKELRKYDKRFRMLKFFLKRKYDQTYELLEFERYILREIAIEQKLIEHGTKVNKALQIQILNEILPNLDKKIDLNELQAFLNTLKNDISIESTIYHILNDDKNVQYALKEKNEYLLKKYGNIKDEETLTDKHLRVLSKKLKNAYEDAYLQAMKKATFFKWSDVTEFEELLLNAEKELFKKTINDEINFNDSESYNKLLHDAYEKEILSHDIVLSTCIATSISALKKIKNFKQLIIDEAGMTKEPEALVPILLCQPEKVVLIGDHKQLRSIVKCQHSRDLGLDQSLFERYCAKVTMLEEQYRMHDSICSFPSEVFYKGKLETRVRITDTGVFWPGTHLMKQYDYEMNKIIEKLTEMRVVFIDVKGEESKLAVHSNEGSENSVRNEKEIECVEEIYKYLAENTNKKSLIESKNIIILTQYRAQVKGIISKLKVADERVLTVITSQGGEWDYVILSTVRSLPDCDIDPKATDGWRKKYLGFISDENQMNVALTRAKKALFIIGMHMNFL